MPVETWVASPRSHSAANLGHTAIVGIGIIGRAVVGRGSIGGVNNSAIVGRAVVGKAVVGMEVFSFRDAVWIPVDTTE